MVGWGEYFTVLYCVTVPLHVHTWDRCAHIIFWPFLEARYKLLNPWLVQVFLPFRGACPQLVVRAHFPLAYPGSLPPLCELQVPRHVSDDMGSWATEQLSKLFAPGGIFALLLS